MLIMRSFWQNPRGEAVMQVTYWLKDGDRQSRAANVRLQNAESVHSC